MFGLLGKLKTPIISQSALPPPLESPRPPLFNPISQTAVVPEPCPRALPSFISRRRLPTRSSRLFFTSSSLPNPPATSALIGSPLRCHPGLMRPLGHPISICLLRPSRATLHRPLPMTPPHFPPTYEPYCYVLTLSLCHALIFLSTCVPPDRFPPSTGLISGIAVISILSSYVPHYATSLIFPLLYRHSHAYVSLPHL